MATDLLTRIKTEGTPLIDGNTVTFVWRGKTAPPLFGDFNNWGNWGSQLIEMKRAAPGVWTHTIELPGDAYIEYGFAKKARGKVDQFHPMPDPFNKRSVPNGVGGRNMVMSMPDAPMTPLIRRNAAAPAGTLTPHEVKAPYALLGGARKAWIYKPPAKGPYPLLLVMDGKDYIQRGKLPIILDNLIAQKRIPPLGALFIDHAGRGRPMEYHCSDQFIAAIQSVLLPLARQELNLVKQDGANIVLGASSSGLGAMWVGMRMPHVFGRVFSQSGAFRFPLRDGASFAPIVHEMARQFVARDLRIFMDCGLYDFLLPCNREYRDLLIACGYDATYHEYAGGHNFTCWRNEMARGLETLCA